MSLIQVKAEHTDPRASRLSQSLLSVQAPSSNSLLSANFALENTLTLFQGFRFTFFGLSQPTVTIMPRLGDI